MTRPTHVNVRLGLIESVIGYFLKRPMEEVEAIVGALRMEILPQLQAAEQAATEPAKTPAAEAAAAAAKPAKKGRPAKQPANDSAPAPAAA